MRGLNHIYSYLTNQKGGGRMKKNQHVVPTGKDWGIRGAGNARLTSVHSTQAEAIQSARSIAKNQQSELFIHNRHGQIRDRDSYGNDPCPPRDMVH